MSRPDKDAAIVEQRLRLGFGFHEADRQRVLTALEGLNRHLEPWSTEQVDIHLAVQARDRREQTVTLEIWLPRLSPLVVHFSDANLGRALVEARKMMIREIEDKHSLSESWCH